MAIENNDNINSYNDAHIVALEWLKQLITLSSGIVLISAAFLKIVFEDCSWFLVLLPISWVLLIISIITALNTISHITKSRIDNNESWTKGRAKTLARVAKWTFIFGIGFLVLFALIKSSLPFFYKTEKLINGTQVKINVEEVTNTGNSAIIMIRITPDSREGG